MEVIWSEFKSYMLAKSLNIQYVKVDLNYCLKIADSFFMLECYLPIDESNADTLDFATNYKALSNQPLKDKVEQVAFGNPGDFRFRGSASQWTSVGANSSVSVDLVLSTTSEYSLNGGEIITSGVSPGSFFKLEVVHPTYGVVETFIKKWYIGSEYTQILLDYIAKVPANIILRCTYTNIGAQACSFGMNVYCQRRGAGS